MYTEPTSSQDSVSRALSELTRLRQFAGSPAEFWNALLNCAGVLAGATQAILAVKKGATPETWQKLAQWPTQTPGDRFAQLFIKRLVEVVEQCSSAGTACVCLEGAVTAGARPFAISVRLVIPNMQEPCVAVALVPAITEPQAHDILLRLQMLADTPVSYQMNQAAQQSRTDIDKFASVLDLMVLVNTEKKYLAAAMAFCNGVSAKFRCDRVSLGWEVNGFIRLQAISRTEKFERGMAAVKALEIAMEEALDQDEEVVWPVAEGISLVTRDHAAFAKDQGIQNLCSLPMRLDGKVVAVLTCERQGTPFSENDVKELRMACDQAVRRLADLKALDRWFGARMMAASREKLGKLVGVENTWAKCIGVLVSVGLILLVALRLNYRLEAKFILHSDELAYVTAPFEGFIDRVPVRVGDAVKSGQALLSLDRRDLELEESSAVADLARFAREAEKARAANLIADMRIAQAMADQAKSKLDLVRYRLDQADLKPPFDGVIVEGEQRERIGAPVKQGEVLFKVARADNIYVEAEVNERDVHELKPNATGELAFTSQPKLKFPMKVVRLIPAAQPKEAQNVFIVRCEVTVPREVWWRPGMTGIAKINVEKRSLLWIVSHRTIDYLRMLLWW